VAAAVAAAGGEKGTPDANDPDGTFF
jgi:hypothetical protein